MTLVLLLLTLSAPARAAAPASTSAAPGRPAPPPENPWSLSYGLDRRGAGFGRVDYRLRWSFEDLRAAGREPALTRLSAERTLRGMLQGSRVELYGLRVRPFPDLSLLPSESYAAAASSAPAGTPAKGARPRPGAWDRLYEDLERSARRETERFLIREGFDRALPAHRAAPFERKKALGEGLLDLGRGGLGEREP
jgi:hypothetical protein